MYLDLKDSWNSEEGGMAALLTVQVDTLFLTSSLWFPVVSPVCTPPCTCSKGHGVAMVVLHGNLPIKLHISPINAGVTWTLPCASQACAGLELWYAAALAARSAISSEEPLRTISLCL
ncbi:Hypothetical predicted protein [Podarcis lilfordi]|uniref:Uncharacterized protein n=1 Tax=Podarcis lilfordi TaxID=74358 RepID=A0AA35LHE7_9SAUR|nr:Hypothetical predicted protein [Podarcis lilfordi]